MFLNKRFLLILFTIFVFFSLNLVGIDTVSYVKDSSQPPDLNIDLLHLEGHFSFVPEKNKIIAKTIFSFKTKRSNIKKISFYAPGFLVNSITLDNKKVKFKFEGKSLIIYPGIILKIFSKHKLEINYSASPKKGLIYFIGWNDKTNTKRKQIWSHRPHGWIPFIDDRLTVDMYFKFDKKYKIFSNGVRVGVKNSPNNTKIWNYRMYKDHPFFSTALVIGDYNFKSLKTKNGLPIELWYYPDQEDHFESTYRYSLKMFEFLEKELGYQYPYELYRQAPVIDYMYGAMETTTATIFGDYMHIDPRAYWQRNYINVNAHELTHQWFGNCIAHLYPKDVWLTEGFATYYAKLFEKEVFGEDYYEDVKRKEYEKAMLLSKKNNNPVGTSFAGSPRWYDKGSLILDMLRDVLGEQEFKQSIKTYLKKYAFKKARIVDFKRVIYDVTGRNIDWFFEQWLARGGEPEYKVSYKINTEMNASVSTVFSVKQTHKLSEIIKLFKMPIVFEVHYKDGTSSSKKVIIKEKFQQVFVKNPMKKVIDYVLFDPGRRVMKKLVFSKSIAELKSQSLKAENVIDRYDALILLRKFKVEDKLKTLIKVFYKEKYYLNKNEVIYQLKDNISSITLKLFRNAINDKDPLVRNGILKHIKNIPKELKSAYEGLLKDYSYANIEIAFENLTNSFPEDTNNYLKIISDNEGWRGLNIKMKWLEKKIESGKRKYINNLIEYSSKRYEFETRMNAIKIFIRLNIMNRIIAKNILTASIHWNQKLRKIGLKAIKFFSEQNKYRKILLSEIYKIDLTGSEKKTLLKRLNN